MRVHVLRHGETDCNAARIYNGRLDEDINAQGIVQAKEAALQVASLPITLIACSPLRRARHTCEIVNTKNIPVMFDSRLQERDCGILTGKPLDDFYWNGYWDFNSTENVLGLEKVPELFDRVADFLEELKEKHPDDEVLLVCHGGVARGVHFYVNDIPEDGMLQRFGSANCGIKTYDI